MPAGSYSKRPTEHRAHDSTAESPMCIRNFEQTLQEFLEKLDSSLDERFNRMWQQIVEITSREGVAPWNKAATLNKAGSVYTHFDESTGLKSSTIQRIQPGNMLSSPPDMMQTPASDSAHEVRLEKNLKEMESRILDLDAKVGQIHRHLQVEAKAQTAIVQKYLDHPKFAVPLKSPHESVAVYSDLPDGAAKWQSLDKLREAVHSDLPHGVTKPGGFVSSRAIISNTSPAAVKQQSVDAGIPGFPVGNCCEGNIEFAKSGVDVGQHGGLSIVEAGSPDDRDTESNDFCSSPGRARALSCLSTLTLMKTKSPTHMDALSALPGDVMLRKVWGRDVAMVKKVLTGSDSSVGDVEDLTGSNLEIELQRREREADMREREADMRTRKSLTILQHARMRRHSL